METLLHWKDASAFTLLSALCHVAEIGFRGEQLNNITTNVMSRFRKFALEVDIESESSATERIYALFLNAQTLDGILYAFREVWNQLWRERKPQSSFSNPFPSPFTSIPEPSRCSIIDPTELTMISRKFEIALGEILKEVFNTIPREDLKLELKEVAKIVQQYRSRDNLIKCL